MKTIASLSFTSFFWVIILSVPFPAVAQYFHEVAKVVASDREPIAYFGHAVSISGDYTIIGAPREDEDTSGSNVLSNAGSAYIFKKSADDSWNQVQKLVASDRGVEDQFGHSVAIDGNYAIVGAHFDGKNATGIDTVLKAGSDYFFERDAMDNWKETQKIVAPHRNTEDLFGSSVALFGKYALVGAPLEDEDAMEGDFNFNTGSVYIYERDANGIWTYAQKIVAADRDYDDNFGTSLSVHGNYAIIGAPKEDSSVSLRNAGAVYIFERDQSGLWKQAQKVIASDHTINNYYGFSVSIHGNHAVVGAYLHDIPDPSFLLTDAGSAYFLERDANGIWNETQKVTASDAAREDEFGCSVSLSGEKAIVSARRKNQDAGTAYIFERDGTNVWSETQKIEGSDTQWHDRFGFSVSLSDDFAVIGAYLENHDASGSNSLTHSGSAYFFYDKCRYWNDRSIIACDAYTVPSGKETYTLPGIYTIADTLEDGMGCDSIFNIRLTIRHLDTSLSVSGNSLTANEDVAAYQWLNCWDAYSPVVGATNKTFTPLTNGSYAVEVTNGCSDTSECVRIVAAGLEEGLSPNDFVFYPSPTSGRVTVLLEKVPRNAHLSINDVYGKEVYQKNSIRDQTIHLNLENLSSGIYFMTIREGTWQKVERLIVRTPE